MRKLKVYLDTSTISHLFADDTPEKMNHTKQLWKDFEAGKFEIYVSPLVLQEVKKCPEPRRSEMLKKLWLLPTTLLPETAEVEQLASEYIKNGVLREKSYDDCTHIAYAVINNCDMIVSWNFKHLVNYKTINKVKIVNAINNYREISIVSPSMLLEWSDEDEL